MPDIIPIPTNSSDYQLVNKEEFERVKKDLRHNKKILDWTFAFIIVILLTCVIAFITFLLDAWGLHREAYKEFKQIVKNQEESMQFLKQENEMLKMKELQKQIDDLKSKKLNNKK